MAQPRICSLLKQKAPAKELGYLSASGDTVPTDASAGYATGCIFNHTDGGAETALYVNEGSVTSSAFVPLLTTSNEVQDLPDIGALAYTAGNVLLADGDSYEETDDLILNKAGTLRVGGFNTGGASTDAAVFSVAAHNTWSDGQLDIGSIFAASTSDLTGAYSAKCARFRHMVVTSSSTVDHETYGAVGQCVVKGTTLTHIHAGLMGTFEGHTSGVVCNSSRYRVSHACVLARLGGHAAITATTPIAGVLAFNNASAALASGSSCALAVDAYSTSYPWTYGLYIPNSVVTTGIAIGTCTTGLTITGATGRAIDIQTTGVVRMGVQGTGITTSTTYPFGLEVHTKTAADVTPGDTGLTAGIYSRYEVGADQTTQCSFVSVAGKLRVKKDLADGAHAGVLGYVEISESDTVIGGTATTTTAAGHFAVEADTNFELSTGHLNGICVDSSVHASATISGTMAGIRVKKGSGKLSWPVGIQVEAASSSVGIQVGTFGSTAAGNGIVLSASNTNGSAFYGDDGGAALTASHTKVLRGRMLVATAISGGPAVTTNGVYGQVKVAASCNVEGYVSGVYGYCEASGAVTLTNTTCCFSGVHARVDVPSGATIAASSFVAGVSIFGDLGGTHTGQATAIHVRAADSGDWDTLMEIPAEVVGGANGGGDDTYIDITIAGVAARITAKYVS